MRHAGREVAEKSEKEVGRIAASRSSFGDWRDPVSRGFIVVVAVTLAWWTWASWGDIQIDCGSDLYVSAEILHGRLLYRDIFYPYGPLIPYVQALLLSFMGPHLVVFYLFGIGVAIGCALLLFEIGAMLESRGAGLTAALALLFTGFSPGIFNYPFPYSYSATTGLLLSLLCVWFTIRHLFARRGYNLLIAGIGAGLAMLCKHEFGAACYLMLGFVLVMEAITRRSVLPLLHGIAACTPGVALWVAIYGWFFWKLTPALMIDGNWLGPGSHFSHTAAGAALVAFLGQRFVPREMVALIVRAALCLLLWFLLAKASRAQRNVVLAIMVAVAGAHRFAPLHLMTGKIRVFSSVAHGIFLVFPRGMFFIGCGFIAYAIYKLNKSADRRYLAEAAFGIFALVPAIRVFAEIAPHGYSIYYAMPLFLVFVIVISRSIKAATTTLPADRQRALVKHLLAAEIVVLALACIPPPTQRTATLETSWGAIRLDSEEANVARQMLAFFSEQKRRGRQVAVLPEAPILYAVTGTEAPGRWYKLVPGILSPAQEQVCLAGLNRAAPDYILLTARRTPEYGLAYFGIDYDQKIYRWIQSNYRVAGEFGRFSRDESGSTLAALLYEKEEPGQGNRSR